MIRGGPFLYLGTGTVRTGHATRNDGNVHMMSTTDGDRRKTNDGLADRLVGIAEIADMAGVSSSAVSNWRTRYDDFPNSVADLRMGPVFFRASVEKWLERWN